MRKSAILWAFLAGVFFGCEKKSGSEVDFDFTTMNFNIATAQVFTMSVEPEKYAGKTVKFRGQFMSIQEEGYSERFYSVLQYDATACCQAGFMFLLPQDKTYPEDYPAEYSEIEVIGTLTLGKTEDGLDLFYLACDSFTPLDSADSNS